MGRQISGTLACFCSDEYEDKGDDAATYNYLASDGSKV